jgi:hypothetical protein
LLELHPQLVEEADRAPVARRSDRDDALQRVVVPRVREHGDRRLVCVALAVEFRQVREADIDVRSDSRLMSPLIPMGIAPSFNSTR